MEFEIGKWYKNEFWTSSKDFCKCIRTNDLLHTERIKDGIYQKREGTWIEEEAEIAEYEEYAQYLPKGHPDKIPPEKEDMSYLIKFLNKVNTK